MTGLVGAATLLEIAILNTRASTQHLATVRTHIEEGIESKGRVLTENHALAMRSLARDNAQLEMQRLVQRAVGEDADVVYGVYVSAERHILAFCHRNAGCGAAKVDEGDVWRMLSLTDANVLSNQLRSRRVRVFGEELLEVAAPVRGELSKEAAGTIRYGFSTRRMNEVLLAAKQDAEERLLRSLLLMGGIVALSSLVGLLLSRLQAVRITRPLSELTDAAEKLAAGDRSVRVDIRSGDELQTLGTSFNKMVQDLDGSYGALEEMNRTLEQKVEARTAELAKRNRDMRLVLDNVDQGFVTLSPDGVMALERSRVLDDWFGATTRAITFWDFLSPHSRAFAVTLRLAWDQITDGFLPLDIAVDQLPSQLVLPHKTFSLRYLHFGKDGQMEGVLVVIADVTQKLAQEREEREQAELMQGFKRLMLDRSGFSNFLREATEMVARICETDVCDSAPLRHTLHTLKGNAGTMGLLVVARLCHALEDQLSESGVMSRETTEELSMRWAAIRQHIAIFTGGDTQPVIQIPHAEYSALVSRLSAGAHEDVLNELLNWQLEPISQGFTRLAEHAQALANRLGRGGLNVVIEPGDIRIDPDTWAPFFSNLVHAVRNAVDHGIETPDERVAAGKPKKGTLSFKAEAGPNSLTLEVSDDGRGIDWAAIAQKAESLGLPAGSKQELFQALMHDGLSTKREISEISGRGVGMGALSQRVRDMGGAIDVRSSAGAGTTWVMRFPWNPSAIPTMRMRRSPPAQHIRAG